MARKPPHRAEKRPRRPQRSGKPAPLRPLRKLPSHGASDSADQTNVDRPGERLQKVLASAGIASRRECEELITEGRVEVDGQVVSELGARVNRNTQEIRVDGEALPRPRLVYYAINKPTGVVTSARDPAGRPRVIDLLPPSAGRVFTVGRLDLASEGLILATNDGELANQLTHPKHGVEKTYLVQVAGHPEPDVLAQLRRGVHLAEGYAHAIHARIKSKLKRSTLLEMVLDEGRNREVRRLLARVGHKVQRLTRIAVGPVRLGEMPRGAHRRLTQEEVRKLREAVAAGPKQDGAENRSRPPSRPVAKRQGAPGSFRRKHSNGSAAPAGGQTTQRKVLGGSKPGDEAAGYPGGDGSRGGRAGGKAAFRKPRGTKLTGRKPVKRRRPERPQRGSGKP